MKKNNEKTKQICYVTGNWFKVKMAKEVLDPLGIEILQKKIDCPEIQANEIEKVAAFSAKFAANELKIPVLVNDSGLLVEELKGFPGPYTKYIEETITEEGILKLMKDIKNRKAKFIEVLVFCEPNKEPIIFSGATLGKINNIKEGEYGWSFDKIFVPENKDKPLACFPDDERWKFWDNSAYKKLAEYLKNEKNC
jgi:XTP/dITP diphosphohydrolase